MFWVLCSWRDWIEIFLIDLSVLLVLMNFFIWKVLFIRKKILVIMFCMRVCVLKLIVRLIILVLVSNGVILILSWFRVSRLVKVMMVI